MHRLIRVMIVLASLWSGWWWLASATMNRAVNSVFDDLRSQGWTVRVAEVSNNGFPLLLRRDMTALSLTDPDGNIRYDIPRLTLSAKAYWPGFANLRLGREPMTLTTATGPVFLQFDDARADLRLHPGPALALDRATLTSGPWQVNDPAGNLMVAQDLSAVVSLEQDAPASYRFEVTSTDLSPGDRLRALLDTPSDAPLVFDAVKGNGVFRLSAPIDRHLARGGVPRPQSIRIDTARIAWGALSLEGNVDMTVGATGTPDGVAKARVQNWQSMLDYAERARVLDPTLRGQVTLMLRLFANMSGTPEDIEVTLLAQDGRLSINGIDLGNAPKLFQP